MMQMEHSGRGPLWRSWPPTARSTRPPQPSDPGKYRWISRLWEISVNITTLPANISPKTSRSSKSPAELEIFPPASPVLAFPMVDDDDSHKSIFFYLLIGQSSITQRRHKDNQKQKLSRHLPSLMSHHHHSCPASLSSVAVCLKPVGIDFVCFGIRSAVVVRQVPASKLPGDCLRFDLRCPALSLLPAELDLK